MYFSNVANLKLLDRRIAHLLATRKRTKGEKTIRYITLWLYEITIDISHLYETAAANTIAVLDSHHTQITLLIFVQLTRNCTNC